MVRQNYYLTEQIKIFRNIQASYEQFKVQTHFIILVKFGSFQ